jgi:hypothetical protein
MVATSSEVQTMQPVRLLPRLSARLKQKPPSIVEPVSYGLDKDIRHLDKLGQTVFTTARLTAAVVILGGDWGGSRSG